MFYAYKSAVVDIFDTNLLFNPHGENDTVVVLQHTPKKGNPQNIPATPLYHHLIIDPTIKNWRKMHQYINVSIVSAFLHPTKKEKNPNFWTRNL